MKKIMIIVMLSITTISLWLFIHSKQANTTQHEMEKQETMLIETTNEKTLILTIDGKKIDVVWESNEVVNALQTEAKIQPISITMHRYANKEQVGQLHKQYNTTDQWLDGTYGDILLYQKNKLVILYDNNSWSYTKLGTITGKTQQELKKLLAEKDVHIQLSPQ